MTTFEGIAAQLEALAVEVPSWAYGNSGTRFKVFGSPGTARTVEEKVDDAATVHRFTGLAPTVALHIPWDTVDDYAVLRKHAEDSGVTLGTINSNTFQDDDYKLGSLTHADPRVRAKAVQHNLDCIEIMGQTGSRDLKVWLADGTNYPGQGDIRARQDWLAEGLHTIYSQLGQDQRLVLEYKFFEPAFYHTDVPDWGTAYVHVAALGTGAGLPGHRSPRARYQHRVHRGPAAAAREARLVRLQQPLLRRRRPHRRQRRPVPAVPDPGRAGCGRRVLTGQLRGPDARPVPQHRAQDPRSAPVSAQRAGDDRTRAAGRPRRRCARRRPPGTSSGANEVLMDAFYTDVRRDLADWREARGLPREPLKAYLASGHQARLETERVGGSQAAWT
jgi:L-rhamnose isomerase/sugar isomerase